MPEGDTVWLAGRRLAAALTGHTLVRGELRHPELSTLDLAGASVQDVLSVGKHLLVRFGDGRSLHTRFRMDGAWHLYRPGRPWRGPQETEAVRRLGARPERELGLALLDQTVMAGVGTSTRTRCAFCSGSPPGRRCRPWIPPPS